MNWTKSTQAQKMEKLYTIRDWRVVEVRHVRGKLYTTTSGEEVVVSAKNIYNSRIAAEQELSKRIASKNYKERKEKYRFLSEEEKIRKFIEEHTELLDFPGLSFLSFAEIKELWERKELNSRNI